ncbi:MAG: c-type cytochrome [Rubrivivax sp.]|nr:c-type cytochrome [Rubrivivax sp.]
MITRRAVPGAVLRSALRPALQGAPGCARGLALALGLLCTTSHAADAGNGARLYRQHCAGCHGADGRPVLPAAPDLSRPMALMRGDLALLAFVKGGRGAMPAFAGVLKDREVLDVLAHLRTLR